MSHKRSTLSRCFPQPRWRTEPLRRTGPWQQQTFSSISGGRRVMYAAQHAGPAHVAAFAALVLLYILPALVAWISRKYTEQPKVGDTAPHAVMSVASRLSRDRTECLLLPRASP